MRVTDKQLQAVVDRINRATRSPLEPYVNIDGKYTAQVGNYHLDYAYGGVGLRRMAKDGGSHDALCVGYVSKRELLSLLFAWLEGYAAKELES